MLAVSALALSSCGNYAIYKIHVTTATSSPIPAPNGSDRTAINQCNMTITDEKGAKVVDGYILQGQVTSDSQGNLGFKGCKGGFTPADLGLFSYSTSRTGGALTFQVDGLNDGMVVLQTGQSAVPVPPQAYPPEMPQINIAMK
jgi:hypothetical protein